MYYKLQFKDLDSNIKCHFTVSWENGSSFSALAGAQNFHLKAYYIAV